MYKCYVCHSETTENALESVSEELYDTVIAHYGLIALTGGDDSMFDINDNVIVCLGCVAAA